MSGQDVLVWFAIAAAVYFGGFVLLAQGVSLSAVTPEEKKKAGRRLRCLGAFF